MTESQFLSPTLLEKLQTAYKNYPESIWSVENDSAMREFFGTSGSELTLKPGEILFLQDVPADGMYWIEDGVLIVLQGILDNPRLLAFRHPGQVVGEIALLENVLRTASVAALFETRLKYLSKEKFQGLLSLIPGFGVELMRLLSARLREVKPAEYSDGLYDHLTGAFSRQAFDVRLREEIERARLYRYKFSLVFLDLDHFKDVNDTYGHKRGDEVLIEFSRRVMSDLRTTDMLFRYGGDEFVLLLQGIDQTRGPNFVQRLLDSSLTTPIPGEPPVTVSFSAGISYFPEDGDQLEVLLQAADQRVYRSKNNGRGRVTGNPVE